MMLYLITSCLATITKLLVVCIALQVGSTPPGLSSAAVEMQSYLNSLPEPNQSGWKLYFDWEKWGPPLTQRQLPERKTLETVTPRFYGVYEGLEQPALIRMRKELRQFLDGAVPPDTATSQPALLIRFNQNLITAELNKYSRSRTDTRETGNWIAGAWVTGMAHSQMNITAQLAPLGDSAAVAVRVSGAISTPHNIAHKGSFQVHGSAESQLNGVAYLYYDNHAIRVTEPSISCLLYTSPSPRD